MKNKAINKDNNNNSFTNKIETVSNKDNKELTVKDLSPDIAKFENLLFSNNDDYKSLINKNKNLQSLIVQASNKLTEMVIIY